MYFGEQHEEDTINLLEREMAEKERSENTDLWCLYFCTSLTNLGVGISMYLIGTLNRDNNADQYCKELCSYYIYWAIYMIFDGTCQFIYQIITYSKMDTDPYFKMSLKAQKSIMRLYLLTLTIIFTIFTVLIILSEDECKIEYANTLCYPIMVAYLALWILALL